MRLIPVLLAATLGLAACGPSPQAQAPKTPAVPSDYQARTEPGPTGEPITVPAIKAAYLNERNMRKRVAYSGADKEGTLVVDPHARVMYHVLANGEAMRFGIAVGRAGKGFTGNATIKRKQAWPSWTPTQNMIRTEPELYAQFAGGVPGGLDNPLGSRALYLYRGGRDTKYRIHGTMDPSSIGKATSAGCIRLFNQDVMDMYEEVPLGTYVHVRTASESRTLEGEMVETPEGYLIPAAQAAAEAAAQAATDVTASAAPVESAVGG